MLSVIICSRDLLTFSKLEKNIATTIGEISYEIIRIDNSKDNKSITKAYNIGINKSRYNSLLFVHEDVIFHTINWGIKLLKILESESIGLVGVAGSKYKSKYPSAFWHTVKENLVLNIVQHYNNKKKTLNILGFDNPASEQDVFVVDGVFLAFEKSSNIRFNEEIEGFHCYDLGISLDFLKKRSRIVVTRDILIEHFSIGNTNEEFIQSIINFHSLYKDTLKKVMPISKEMDKIALQKFLNLCIENRIIPIGVWLKFVKMDCFNRLNFALLKLFLYKKMNRK